MLAAVRPSPASIRTAPLERSAGRWEAGGFAPYLSKDTPSAGRFKRAARRTLPASWIGAARQNWAGEQVGHAIVLDVRMLTQLSVRRSQRHVGQVLGGIGIGVGVVAGILLTATAVVLIVAAAESIPSFVPK